MIVKAIIFDFDGVIVESMEIKARAFKVLFKDYPGKIDKIIDLHMMHGGLSRFKKFEMIYRDILHQPLSDDQKQDLGNRFACFVYQEVLKCPFVNGAPDFLNRYYQELILFIISGTPEEEIKSLIQERGLKKYFKEVLGAPRKKAELNQYILNRYKYEFNAKEVLSVGDSIDDYEGAKKSGIKFIGRINQENPFKDLKIEGSIRDLFDLERIINAKEKI